MFLPAGAHRERSRGKRSIAMKAGTAKDSRRVMDGDFRHRQMRVATIMSPCDFDLDIGVISGTVSDRLGQQLLAESFGRRFVPQVAMGTVDVVPASEAIQASLNSTCRRSHEHEPLPELECPEKTLDFSVCQHCQMHSIRQVKRNVCG